MNPDRTLTDEVLLDRARNNDQQAFRLLVERYEGKVAATIISMVGRSTEAEDIGQEVFIRFYKSIERFQGNSSLGTYLIRIAINESLSALQKRKRRLSRFFNWDREEAVEYVESDDYRDVDLKERSDLVHAVLRSLKPEDRAVVVLRILEGYSTRDTAELLGIPEGTVMSRLSRSLDRLETRLKPLLSQ